MNEKMLPASCYLSFHFYDNAYDNTANLRSIIMRMSDNMFFSFKMANTCTIRCYQSVIYAVLYYIVILLYFKL